MSVPITEALQLAILLLERVQTARASDQTAIEIDDLGKEFAEVNRQIQAALAARG